MVPGGSNPSLWRSVAMGQSKHGSRSGKLASPIFIHMQEVGEEGEAGRKREGGT